MTVRVRPGTPKGDIAERQCLFFVRGRKRRHRRKAMSFFVSSLQGTLQSKSLQVKYLQGFFFSVTPYFDGTLMEHLTFDL